ncbi:MAG: undecaprenyl-diphosphate phosphatase [archaeon]|nr:undecaprenyl-diphosphate phosphatase [archaeon]
MDIIQAMIIGLVQGLTEFLPVSSSAHLIFAQQFLGVTEPSLAFDVLLHLGTLVAVVGYFFKDIVRMIIAFFKSLLDIVKGRFKSEIKRDPYKKLAWFTILATIPVGIAGIAFDDLVESLFTGITLPAFFLLITGCLLFASQRMNTGKINIDEINWKEALILGCGQACALLPGLSRSGTTIATGLLLDLDKEFAAKFSFILSIPAILGATVIQLKDVSITNVELTAWIAGFAIAAISGYLAIKFLLKLIKERSLDVFAYYCWIIGIIILVATIFFGM